MAESVTAEVCEAAAAKAVSWLEAVVKEDRHTALPFGALYKFPYAFAMAGRHVAGNVALDHICREFQTSPGVFGPEPAPGSEPDFGGIMRWYFRTVVLVGAAQLGRWDVASPDATRAVISQIRDTAPGCGGIGMGAFLSVNPSAMAGLYLLHRGEIEAALRLARFVVAQVEADSKVFYALYDVEAAEVVKDTSSHPSRKWLSGRKVLYCVDPEKERQHSYAPGLAATFLAEVYAMTRMHQFLNAASDLIRFDMRCTWQGDFRLWRSKCKIAWGAANLLRFLEEKTSVTNGRQDDESPEAKRAKKAVGLLSAAEVAAHLKLVTKHCFLDNQTVAGDFGPYHFPLGDGVVDKLPEGCIAWTDIAEKKEHCNIAEKMGVPADHFAIGSAEELCAEFIYEFVMVSRALARKS